MDGARSLRMTHHSGTTERRVRVCVSTYAPGQGGLQSVTSNLCRYLMGIGCDVTPVYLANPVSVRRLPSYLFSARPRREPAWGSEGIAVDHLSHLELFQYLVPSLKARRALKGFDVYQVIRGANLGEGFFSASGFRYVDWVATTIADERRTQHRLGKQGAQSSQALAVANRVIYGMLLRREGRLLRQAARVCAISRYVRDRIVEAHNLPADDVEVIPLPVNTEGFVPAPAGRSNSRDRFLLCVGRLEDPRKNLGLLLDAFGRVRRRLGRIRLRLVGPLEQKDWLGHELQRWGVADGVDYVGEVGLRELVRLYQEADAVLLSSRQEGFGLVLAEAMACETPVVATRCGGPEDVVRDGETGFLVPCDDPVAMANAIEHLFSDDRLRHRMGEAAREHVCRSFSLDVVGARILEVYRQVYPDLFAE